MRQFFYLKFEVKKILFYLVLIWMLISVKILSQKGIVRGIVIDGSNHFPLLGANIALKNYNLFTTSDKNGYFEFDKLNIGQEYIVEISFIGYKKTQKKVVAKEEDKREIVVIHLFPIAIELSQAVVMGKHSNFSIKNKDDFFYALTSKDLSKDLGMTLASTLKNLASVSIRSMGPTTARPILRGLGSDRIVLLEDGLQSNDLSASSPDHAVSIDPTNAERIEVIYGPKVLLYSNSVSGGAINVEKNKIPFENRADAIWQISTLYESANNAKLVGGNFETSIYRNIMLKIDGSYKYNDDLYTPTKRLKNTDARILNLSSGGSYTIENFSIGGSISFIDMTYGVPGGFLGAHLYGADISILKKNYELKGIYKINNSEEFVEINLARTNYKHTEVEDKAFLGAIFGLYENLFDIRYTNKNNNYFDNIIIGAEAKLKKNYYGSYVYTMPSKTTSYSSFIFLEKKLKKFETQFALRGNYAEVKPSSYKISRIGEIRKREFLALSISLASQYNLFSNFYSGANLSLNSKLPTIEELFSEGPHLAAYSYEIGNPSLKTEKGISGEFFLYWLSENEKYMANIFYYHYNDYITARRTKDTNWATLLPIYKTEGLKAAMYGYEMVGEKKIGKIKASVIASYTRGKNLSDNLNLPMIPPFKGSASIEINPIKQFKVGLSTVVAAKQNMTDIFEKDTPGYILYNALLRYDFFIDNSVNVISVSVENLTNEKYKNHLSRTKDAFYEAGRNVKIAYKISL